MKRKKPLTGKVRRRQEIKHLQKKSNLNLNQKKRLSSLLKLEHLESSEVNNKTIASLKPKDKSNNILDEIIPDGNFCGRTVRSVIENPIFIASNAFLRTKVWKQLRNQVRLNYSLICMKCGSTRKICVDHIKPRKYFPELALDYNNLQLLCEVCNKQKGNKDYTDYRKQSCVK